MRTVFQCIVAEYVLSLGSTHSILHLLMVCPNLSHDLTIPASSGGPHCNPSTGSLRQEDGKLEASLGYTVSTRLVLHNKTLSPPFPTLKTNCSIPDKMSIYEFLK